MWSKPQQWFDSRPKWRPRNKCGVCIFFSIYKKPNIVVLDILPQWLCLNLKIWEEVILSVHSISWASWGSAGDFVLWTRICPAGHGYLTSGSIARTQFQSQILQAPLGLTLPRPRPPSWARGVSEVPLGCWHVPSGRPVLACTHSPGDTRKHDLITHKSNKRNSHTIRHTTPKFVWK